MLSKIYQKLQLSAESSQGCFLGLEMLVPAIVLVLVTTGAGRVTRNTPALQGEIATQLVITDTGATAVCDLEVGIAGSQISKASVKIFKYGIDY